MTIHIKVAGVWKEVDVPHIKVAGVWKAPDSVHVKVAGVWREAYTAVPPLSVSGGNLSAGESGFSVSGRVPASGSVSAFMTVTGGVGPFTYAWTKLTSADGSAFVAGNTTSLNANWYGIRSDLNFDNTETWRLTVTDTGDGNNTATADISITLTWTNLN